MERNGDGKMRQPWSKFFVPVLIGTTISGSLMVPGPIKFYFLAVVLWRDLYLSKAAPNTCVATESRRVGHANSVRPLSACDRLLPRNLGGRDDSNGRGDFTLGFDARG
jgi:hypothetical protein